MADQLKGKKETVGQPPLGYPQSDEIFHEAANPRKHCRWPRKGNKFRSARDRGCIEGCLAALCCCGLLDECCCDPTVIVYD
eukprot:c43442_g1_i1 orf=112-354(+)